MKHRLEHLDMLRGVAALLVCAGHLRAFLFVDYAAVVAPGWLEAGFYSATRLGHQAVIVFFALSGFLVGGKAAEQLLARTWSFPAYSIRRLSRLWTVAIPALFLTLFWDRLGVAFGGGPGYAGQYYDALLSGPIAGSPPTHSLAAFLGNVAFLQTITVPVFGTNGPAWSLACEFWYYLAFPLLLFALLPGGPARWRITALVAVAVMSALLPLGLQVLGVVWVLGAAAFLVVGRLRRLPTLAVAGLLAVVAGLGAGALLFSVFRPGLDSDLALGAASALLLPVLALLPNIGGLYGRAALGLSEISYTLYLTHFPFFAAICFAAIAPRQWSPDVPSSLLYAGLLAAGLAYAVGVWWCFERNTDRIRVAAVRLLTRLRGRIDSAG